MVTSRTFPAESTRIAGRLRSTLGARLLNPWMRAIALLLPLIGF
jgi:hypothetical protein